MSAYAFFANFFTKISISVALTITNLDTFVPICVSKLFTQPDAQPKKKIF